MRRSVTILLVFISLAFVSSDEILTEDGVMVLTNDNFKGAIESNEFILVEFYAPWCGHCKKLAPEYARAAEILAEKDSKIKLAKVDAQANRKLGDQFKVQGYPTLKYFRQGIAIEYKGGRHHESIVEGVEKRAEPPALPLTTVEATEKFINDNDVVVVGFFRDKESSDAKTLLEIANNMEDIAFGITNQDSIFDANEVSEDGVVLFKSFDEKRNDFKGKIIAENVEKFIRTNSLPLVIEFKSSIASKLFLGEVLNAIFLFVDSSDEQYSAQKEMAVRIAKEFKGKVMMVLLDVDDDDLQKFLDLLGVQKENVPTMRLMHGVKNTYGPEIDGIDEDHVRNFVQQYLEGKLVPRRWLKSEDVPSNWNENPVKVLVGRNFHEVISGDKNVFVMFYAPWCGFCKELKPIWDELGEKFDGHDNVIIAKMDATANDLVDFAVSSYPTVKIFKGSVENSVDSKERTLERLIMFLSAHRIKLEQKKYVETKKDEL